MKCQARVVSLEMEGRLKKKIDKGRDKCLYGVGEVIFKERLYSVCLFLKCQKLEEGFKFFQIVSPPFPLDKSYFSRDLCGFNFSDFN